MLYVDVTVGQRVFEIPLKNSDEVLVEKELDTAIASGIEALLSYLTEQVDNAATMLPLVIALMNKQGKISIEVKLYKVIPKDIC